MIDPGAQGKRIIELIRSADLLVRFIVNTHAHIDHVGANATLSRNFKVPILMSEKDLQLYRNPGYGLNLVRRRQPEPEQFIADGDSLKCGSLDLEVLDTPGHTPGGICLKAGGSLFCGDTIFAGSIGRTDLAGGSSEALILSIRQKLLPLPPETVLYPGHGPETSIGAESACNPYISPVRP